MQLTYQKLKKRLHDRYQLERTQSGYYGYYKDEQGVVASVSPRLITLYYECSRDSLWNHHNKIAASVIKDFELIENKQGIQADVLKITRLCGTCNDVKLVNPQIIDSIVNDDLTYEAIGKSTDQLLHEYKELRESLNVVGAIHSLDQQISMLDKKLKQESNKMQYQRSISSYGTIKREGNQIHLMSEDYDISFSEAVYSDSIEEDRFVILKRKRVLRHPDLEVFNYYREKYDWNYTIGKRNAGTPDIMEFVNRRLVENYEQTQYAKVKSMK